RRPTAPPAARPADRARAARARRADGPRGPRSSARLAPLEHRIRRVGIEAGGREERGASAAGEERVAPRHARGLRERVNGEPAGAGAARGGPREREGGGGGG